MTWTHSSKRAYCNIWNRAMRRRVLEPHDYVSSTHCGECHRAYNRRRTRRLARIPTEELRAELERRAGAGE
jgi:hypothetical protein